MYAAWKFVSDTAAAALDYATSATAAQKLHGPGPVKNFYEFSQRLGIEMPPIHPDLDMKGLVAAMPGAVELYRKKNFPFLNNAHASVDWNNPPPLPKVGHVKISFTQMQVFLEQVHGGSLATGDMINMKTGEIIGSARTT